MTRGDAAERLAVPAVLAAAVLALSVALGPDASWDLRNYHLYSPFALLRKAPGTDLVAAQLQGFLPPTADVIPYLLRARLAFHPALLDVLLGLPTALGAVLAYRIGLLLVPACPGRWLAVLLAVVFGVTGASGLPTIGTSMSEMPAGCFVLAALWLLLRRLRGLGAGWHEAAAGALLGVAVALKLTVVPWVLAMGAAVLLCAGGGVRGRVAMAVRLGAGLLAGAVVVGGPWWLHLYRQTGNPIFPYYNDIFRSPMSAPVAMTDGRFLPHGWGQALAYPFLWGAQKTRLVSEGAMRDPRFALAALAVLAAAATAVWRRRWPDRAQLAFLLFTVLGFVVWERQFAIFRYIAPLELLAGLPILLALPVLGRAGAGAGAAMLALGLFLGLFTRYPDWGRVSPPTSAAFVVLPDLPRDAMVLLVDDAPLSYLAAFADPAVRFIGASNNLVHPGGGTGLDRLVEAAVRGHRGPLWFMELPDSPTAAAALAYYGLQRAGPCAEIRSNLEGGPPRLCPLQRAAPA